ncbi:hypothetical protein SAMN05444411_10874 [Lutibacter oricola]|uniref:Lipoprotein n=1 Tax=Lutibacter oricola TaxID=762486 RepID=A0A1H3DV42_9FLAO|nr:hypothetical protein [Lutibacter oricola]SDX69988.1 hypothetical protein SAMN05444411_10874 [Lutibacter oricola]
MKYLFSLLIIVLVFLVSCNKSPKLNEVSKTNDTIVNSDKIVSTISTTLIPSAKKAIENWKEYKDLDEFLLKYYNISKFEALTNAKELTGLVKLMKDSIRVENLKSLNVKARINVLENQTLRLADMALISSISDEEVTSEVLKIVELYDAFNSKINTIYKAEEIQKALEIDTESPVLLEEEKVTKRINSTRKKAPKAKIPLKNRKSIQ